MTAPDTTVRPPELDVPPEDGGPPIDDPETADLGDGMTAAWSEDYGFTTIQLRTDLDDLPLMRHQMDTLREFADRHWPAPAADRQEALGVARTVNIEVPETPGAVRINVSSLPPGTDPYEHDATRTALAALCMATERLLDGQGLPPDVETAREAVKAARAILGIGGQA